MATGSFAQSPRPSRSPGPVKTTMDWPLSRAEKQTLLVHIYQRESEASAQRLQSDPAVVQSVKDEIRRAQREGNAKDAVTSEDDEGQYPLLTTPEKKTNLEEEQSVGDLEAECSTSGTPSDTSGIDSMVRNLHRLSGDSDSSNGVDPALIQDAMQALSRLYAASAVAKLSKAESSPPRERQTKSVPERQCTTPRSALRRKRYSRGPNDPQARVRFNISTALDSGSDEEALKLDEKVAKPRGRSRRVSRGPDGRLVQIKQAKGENKESRDKITTAAATAVAGGVGGSIGGGITGAIAGLPLALFTFGLSIPIGAAVGTGVGMAAGTAGGAAYAYRKSNQCEEGDGGDAEEETQ